MAVNWMRLVSQNRAKGFKNPWSEEEIKAITTLKDSVKKEYLIKLLREGVVLEKALAKIEKGNGEFDAPIVMTVPVVGSKEEIEEALGQVKELEAKAADTLDNEQLEDAGLLVPQLTEEILKNFMKLKAFADKAGVDTKTFKKKDQILEQLEKLGIKPL